MISYGGISVLNRKGWYDIFMAFSYENHGVKPIPPDANKVFQGNYFGVWQWHQKLYDGSTAIFERISRADYAYMLGVTKEGKILLVEDEQPDRGLVLTPAGGAVETGEDPQQAATREFLEETGFAPQRVVHWHSYRPSTKMEHKTHAFIGYAVEKVSEPTLEPGEKIKTRLYSLEDFLQLGRNPKLRDWLLRIFLLEAMLDNNKREELSNLLLAEYDN